MDLFYISGWDTLALGESIFEPMPVNRKINHSFGDLEGEKKVIEETILKDGQGGLILSNYNY